MLIILLSLLQKYAHLDGILWKIMSFFTTKSTAKHIYLKIKLK